MKTDTSERGLERLICTALTGAPCDPGTAGTWCTSRLRLTAGRAGSAATPPTTTASTAVDLAQLRAFLQATQPKAAEALDLDQDGPTRRKFLARLQGEISKRGVDRRAAPRRQARAACTSTCSTARPRRATRRRPSATPQNRFSVTRQLRYSRDETQLALDLGLFINGLPVATFELKNSLTKQTVEDAVEQYKRDRDPRERLFEFGRCVVHFAVDDHEVRFCTHLKGKASWFLPFNQGWNDGAGNPPNPDGLKTDYLWKRILTREGLTDILENYAQVVETKDEKTGKKKRGADLPALPPARRGAQAPGRRRPARRGQALPDPALGGQRQVATPSPGWPTSSSACARTTQPVFDSIIVVTDRRILDQQIRDTIKQFAQVGATVGHAEHSGDLRKFIEERQEDHHHHGAEVPVHPRRDRQRAPRPALRHHHRRGALQPGRAARRRR